MGKQEFRQPLQVLPNIVAGKRKTRQTAPGLKPPTDSNKNDESARQGRNKKQHIELVACDDDSSEASDSDHSDEEEEEEDHNNAAGLVHQSARVILIKIPCQENATNVQLMTYLKNGGSDSNIINALLGMHTEKKSAASGGSSSFRQHSAAKKAGRGRGSPAGRAATLLCQHGMFCPKDDEWVQALAGCIAQRDADIPLDAAVKAAKEQSMAMDFMKKMRERRGVRSKDVRKHFDSIYQVPSPKQPDLRTQKLADLKQDGRYRKGEDGADCSSPLFVALLEAIWSTSATNKIMAQRRDFTITKEKLTFTIAVIMLHMEGRNLQSVPNPEMYYSKIHDQVKKLSVEPLRVVEEPALPEVGEELDDTCEEGEAPCETEFDLTI
eukprot:jgi/Chlat1/6423/Chrsp45S05943